jgi:hypothetical protein
VSKAKIVFSHKDLSFDLELFHLVYLGKKQVWMAMDIDYCFQKRKTYGAIYTAP